MVEQLKANVNKAELVAFAVRFGRTVRKARQMTGMTQRECAYALGVPRTVFINIESGDSPYIPLMRGLKLCQILGVQLDELGDEREEEAAS